MAKTHGNPNVKTYKFGKVQLKLGLHTGEAAWVPKGGAATLDKAQRQRLCEQVLEELNAWDKLPFDVKPGQPHPEEHLMYVWGKLFGGAK